MVDEFPQAQVPGEGGRQEQAGIGHQARWSSKAMRIRSGLFCGSIYWVLLVSGRVSVPKPLSQIQREPPPVSSRAVPKAVLRWIRAKAIGGDGGQLKTKAPAGSPRA